MSIEKKLVERLLEGSATANELCGSTSQLITASLAVGRFEELPCLNHIKALRTLGHGLIPGNVMWCGNSTQRSIRNNGKALVVMIRRSVMTTITDFESNLPRYGKFRNADEPNRINNLSSQK